MNAPVFIAISTTEATEGDVRSHARRLCADALIHALDLGITRGDGIFESVGVLNGRPLELEAHLQRLTRSADMLDLTPPGLAAIREAFDSAVRAHEPVPELLVKIYVTRGVEGRGTPTAWVHAAQGPDYRRMRSEGIVVVTLDRGYRHDVAVTSPWLLQGAKTLSYAVNQASIRESRRRGADDVIFVSSDGFALEGPTSTLILRDDAGFHTPPRDFGILPGTTQARMFGILGAAGFNIFYSRIELADLYRATGMWLVSSGRLIVPINRLDGSPVPVDRELTAMALDALFEQHAD